MTDPLVRVTVAGGLERSSRVSRILWSCLSKGAVFSCHGEEEAPGGVL